MNAATTWKEKLAGYVEEIDTFETQILWRKEDKMKEKLFAETCLRHDDDGLPAANDYLNAPNEEAGESALCTVLTKLFADTEYTVGHDDDARLRLNLRIRAKTDADSATLLGNLAA